MIYDPLKFHDAVKEWFRLWVLEENEKRKRGWKQAFEKKLNLPTGYFYKLQKGRKPLLDITHLTQIANEAYLEPSDILKQIEDKLK